MRYTVVALGEAIAHVDLDAAALDAREAWVRLEPLPAYAHLRPRLERAIDRMRSMLATRTRRAARPPAPSGTTPHPLRVPPELSFRPQGRETGERAARRHRRARLLRCLHEQHTLALSLHDAAGEVVPALVTFSAPQHVTATSTRSLGDRPLVRVLLGAWPDEPIALGEAMNV